MTNESTTSNTGIETSYLALFEALAGNYLLLKTNAPHFTIVAASPQITEAFGLPKDALNGKNLVDVLSNDLSNGEPISVVDLKESLQYVLHHKKAHYLSNQKYSVNGQFNSFYSRHWNIINKPILDSRGEVAFLLFHAEEVTPKESKDGAEDTLLRIEKAYHFFMSAPVIIGYVKGDNYIIELANEGLLEVWGRTAEVVGQPLLQAIPELEAQGFIALLDNVRKTGEPFYAYKFPITLVRNGKEEVIYFDFVYKPYYENEGDSVAAGVISIGYDVTAQVLANQKVEDARKDANRLERLYEAINGATPDLVYVFDLNYKFTYANKALLNMWGRTWEEAIGKGLIENGYEPWHAEMHEREIDQVVATRQQIRGEVSFPHATLGKRIYDYIFVPVLNESGEVEAVAGTTRDITEIKQAEQTVRESNDRFRNLADDSPMFVFMIDADPVVTVSYWNKTWLTYTGQTYEEAQGRAWNGIIHPDDIPVVMTYYSPAFEKQEAYFIPAVRVKRHDGVYRWHAFKGNPRYLPNGTFDGYVGVGFDIHEQKEAEEALKESEIKLQQKVAERTAELEKTVEELKRSNANLEEFAYAASHDLKEPIRKIHFFGDRIKETMRDRMTTEEVKYFERMESASKRMGTLIDDLLSYSQISIRPRAFEDVNMNQLIRLVLEDLDLEIEDKKAVIKVDNLFTIQGHQRQLQQAFQNLISNALKYSKGDVVPEIRISASLVKGSETPLRLSEVERDKVFYCIAITDNGIGFPQEDAERIFNVFTRLHGNVEYRGTGIGLSIVRKVVENHNGFIWAQSEPGKGATFKVLLPSNKR